MTQIELKPCPFCGGEKITEGYIRDGGQISCRGCGAATHAFLPNAIPKAKEKWNTRHEAAQAPDQPVERTLEWVMTDPSAEAQQAFMANWLRGTIRIPDEAKLRIWLGENGKRGLIPNLDDPSPKREFSDQDVETTLKIANAAIKRNGVMKDALQKLAKQKLHAEHEGYEGGYTEPDTNAFIYTSDWDMAQDEILEEVRNMAKQALTEIEGGSGS